MNPVHSYRAYGLRIDSDFEIPELATSDGSPADVTVTLGELPEPATTGGLSGLWESGPDDDRLHVEGVARYLAAGGSRIVVHPLPQARMDDVRAHMLSSLFAAILHQRQALVLHASAVATDRGAVLFAGVSGAGKSTMLAGLVDRGHAMLADDKAVIVPDAQGLPCVQPGGPRMRLTAATVRALNVPVGDTPLAHFLDKHVLPARRHWAAAMAVRTVYLLEDGGGADIELTTIPQVDAFNALVTYTYRRRLVRSTAQRQAHFGAVSLLARQCRVVRVQRQAIRPSVEQVLARLEEDLRA